MGDTCFWNEYDERSTKAVVQDARKHRHCDPELTGSIASIQYQLTPPDIAPSPFP